MTKGPCDLYSSAKTVRHVQQHGQLRIIDYRFGRAGREFKEYLFRTYKGFVAIYTTHSKRIRHQCGMSHGYAQRARYWTSLTI
jgi:hypothetical protein